ncbi:MAG: amidohydrolase family protein [Pyrinomonadaceae bacterium]
MHADVKRHLSYNWTVDAQSDPKVYTANKRALVTAMHRAGVRLLSATDMPGFSQVPGFSLHDEFVLLSQAGLSPLEVLQAATINPARVLGQEKQMGTVERGKVADLLLLDANLLEDIRNTRRINAVVTNGRYLPKEALQKMLAEVEALASKESIAEAVFTTIHEKGIAPALEQYRQLREEHSATYQLDEREMNVVGYRLLRSKQMKEAIEIFKLNVEAFRESSNVYDSLGEAYAANGDIQLAIRNYQRSLELDSENTNGIEMLKKLRAK